MNLTALLAELTAHLLTILLIARLVLDTLEPLPGDRKCFRMINGVLVERTVQDVIPALRTNAEGLKRVLDDLVKQYKVKQDDLEKWKVGNPCKLGYSRLATTTQSWLRSLRLTPPSNRKRIISRLFSHDATLAPLGDGGGRGNWHDASRMGIAFRGGFSVYD